MRLRIALLLTGLTGCMESDQQWVLDEETLAKNVGTSAYGLAESGSLLYEGSCSYLAACANGNPFCGASRTCSDTIPWVARPSTGYDSCGDCVRICRNDSPATCVDAEVWDTSCCGHWEGNVAVFVALGLSFSDGACNAGSGLGDVTITSCSAPEPTETPDPTQTPNPTSTPTVVGPACGSPVCDQNWCGQRGFEGHCPLKWKGNGQCDCGCQFEDPDCNDDGRGPRATPTTAELSAEGGGGGFCTLARDQEEPSAGLWMLVIAVLVASYRRHARETRRCQS